MLKISLNTKTSLYLVVDKFILKSEYNEQMFEDLI